MTRPTLRVGSTGSQVELVQECLNVTPIDGDFGQMTETAVMEYQRAEAIGADGVVGPTTWAHLEDDFDLPPYVPPSLPPAFDQDTIDAICAVAADSAIADYSWRDRGRAPPGYIQGMALAFGMTVQRLRANDPAALEMAKANTGNDDKDALSWYNSNFQSLGMSNASDGIDTLRHLYALMLGLGMRESSGKHCEGVDQSASNHESDTAEAGLFQTSWNIHSCSDEIDSLFDQYSPALDADLPQCYSDVFAYGVSCSQSSWKCYGSGQGYQYQAMSKSCPPFHTEVTAIGLRKLRQHWGPINRKEAELRKDADIMFKAVQDIVAQLAPPEPEPPLGVAEVRITIRTQGNVRVTVNDETVS